MPNLSIKQIADSIGVPKIKVYKYIKVNNIPETLQERSTMLYDEQTVDRIVSAFREAETTPQTAPEALQSVSQNTAENTLETVIATLTAQLKVKDEQLAAKDIQIEQLTVALTVAQETQQQLTNSLTAAQALHAGTIQQQLVDKSDKGFFRRIFKKKEKTNDETT